MSLARLRHSSAVCSNSGALVGGLAVLVSRHPQKQESARGVPGPSLAETLVAALGATNAWIVTAGSVMFLVEQDAHTLVLF